MVSFVMDSKGGVGGREPSLSRLVKTGLLEQEKFQVET